MIIKKIAGIVTSNGKNDKSYIVILEQFEHERWFLTKILEHSLHEIELLYKLIKDFKITDVVVDLPLTYPLCHTCIFKNSCYSTEHCMNEDIIYIKKEMQNILAIDDEKYKKNRKKYECDRINDNLFDFKKNIFSKKNSEHILSKQFKRKLKKGFLPYWNRPIDFTIWVNYYDQMLSIFNNTYDSFATTSLMKQFKYEYWLSKLEDNQIIETNHNIVLLELLKTNIIELKDLKGFVFNKKDDRTNIMKKIEHQFNIFIYENDMDILIKHQNAFTSFLLSLAGIFKEKGTTYIKDRFFFPAFSICLLFYLFSFIVQSANALDFSERVEGAIVKISDNNKRFVIDKGVEDGIIEGDIANLYVNEKLVGITVAVVAKEDISEWVIDRGYYLEYLGENVNVELISKYGYSGYNKRPFIENLERLKKNSILLKMYEEAKEKYLAKEQERLINEKKILYEEYRLKRYKYIKIPDINFKINASPISIRSPHNEKMMNYGFFITNLNQQNYAFSSSYQYSGMSYTFNSNNDTYSSSEYYGDIFFSKKNMFQYFDHTSMFQFRRERDGSLYPIEYQFFIGPIGIKYKFKPFFKKITDLSVSYIPGLETYSSDKKNYTNSSQNISIVPFNETYFRHSIIIQTQVELTETLKIENDLSWRPYHNYKDNKFDFNNNDFKNKLKLKYEIYPEISISYVSKFAFDIRKKENLNQASSSWENGLYIFYDINYKNKI